MEVLYQLEHGHIFLPKKLTTIIIPFGYILFFSLLQWAQLG